VLPAAVVNCCNGLRRIGETTAQRSSLAWPYANAFGCSVENVARKLVDGYVPPIIVFGIVQFKKADEVVGLEEVANLSAIEPQARIFDELNCSERMTRTLSASVQVDGKWINPGQSDWEYVSPETNVATLLKILCRS
jgi:hypothetical protein